MKFRIITLGCKVNQFESDAIAQELSNSGWSCANANETAHICIINTCTVTEKASSQSRQALRQAIRANPGTCVIVTGCYAQTEADAIRKIKGVHHVIGHADKYRIPNIVRDVQKGCGAWEKAEQPIDCTTLNRFQKMPFWGAGGRTRPFLKIQDGCNAFCSYCVVPIARGRSCSMPLEDVLTSLRQMSSAGFLEVVLTGIHLGCYGLDFSPKQTLLSVLNAIKAENLPLRIRLSSIEPREISPALIDFIADNDWLCRHVHIPLQSGDDNVLSKMKRPYTRAFFRDLVERIHAVLPTAAIGVDTLIGFPGETEAAFENTYALICDLPVTYLHVFPFSPRKGTRAATFTNPVDIKTITTRCRKMRDLGRRKKRQFYASAIGCRERVLVEGKQDPVTQCFKGWTSNYVPVLLRETDVSENTLVSVRLDKLGKRDVVYGSICTDDR